MFPLALTNAEGDFDGCCPGVKPQGWGLKEPRDQRVWGKMCVVIGVVIGPLGVVNLEEGENGLSGDQWRTG